MEGKINVAVVGLGNRGFGLLKNVLISLDDVRVAAVCDLYKDRTARAAETVYKATGRAAEEFSDCDLMLEKVAPDAVIIACSWENHIKIACSAMEKGIAAAMEVGGCYSVDEAWRLVRTYEKTRVPFMMLENCCFDKNETLATNLARAGKLGRIVHCSGAYAHDLREEIAGGERNRHYRLKNYLLRNCENYPTHELGPIAKLLDINRGNRFIKLCSVASLSAGMESYIADNADRYPELAGKKFAQGDIVDTIITCAGGETVHIKLDTTLPRFYDRAFTVRGTKGLFDGSAEMVFIDGIDEDMFDTAAAYRKMAGNAGKYSDYLPDEWKNITPAQLAAGHGGMDYFTLREFFDCLKNDAPMPVDVYDAAAWMSVSALSEQSIGFGGAPVDIPDFTCGAWLTRPRLDVSLVKERRK